MEIKEYANKVHISQVVKVTLENLKEVSYWTGGRIDGDSVTIPKLDMVVLNVQVGQYLMRCYDGTFDVVTENDLNEYFISEESTRSTDQKEDRFSYLNRQTLPGTAV